MSNLIDISELPEEVQKTIAEGRARELALAKIPREVSPLEGAPAFASKDIRALFDKVDELIEQHNNLLASLKK